MSRRLSSFPNVVDDGPAKRRLSIPSQSLGGVGSFAGPSAEATIMSEEQKRTLVEEFEAEAFKDVRVELITIAQRDVLLKEARRQARLHIQTIEEAHDHEKRTQFTRRASQELLEKQQFHEKAKRGNGFDRRPVAPDLDFYERASPQQKAVAAAEERRAAVAAASTDLDLDDGDWSMGAAGASTDLDGAGGSDPLSGETDLDSVREIGGGLNDSTNLDGDDDEAAGRGMRRKFSKTTLQDAGSPTTNSKVGMADYAKRIHADFEAAAFRGKNPRAMTAAQRSHILKAAKRKAEAYIRANEEHDAEKKRVGEEEALLNYRTVLYEKHMRSSAPTVLPSSANPRISPHSWQASPHVKSPPPVW